MNDLNARYTRRLGAPLWALALLACGAARADDMLVTDSHLIQGSTAPSTVSYSFNVSGPGAVTVSLADVVWPSALTDLSLTLSGSNKPLGQLIGSGTDTFDISGAGTYYAYVTGEASNPSNGLHLNLGLYSLNISFQPLAAVPLPASFGLLASALACMGLLAWRRKTLKV